MGCVLQEVYNFERNRAGSGADARGIITVNTASISGEWEIDLVRRELRTGGAYVPLGGRAFEILALLVRAGGETVTKDQLIAGVWPGAIVEDNTIQVHISAIRRALGAERDLLLTSHGRGYRLSGQWTVRNDGTAKAHAGAAPKPAGPRAAAGNLPAAGSDLIGRSAILQQVRELLSAYRVVTLCGTGGIGKTRLALEMARDLRAGFAGDVRFVELAALTVDSLMPAAVAAALDLELGGSGRQAAAVARAIGARKLLLLLDNCEHVIDAAAELAETVIRTCPDVTILATSREPLRIDGECAVQVPPLDVPPVESLVHTPGPGDVVAEHSAMTLFTARVRQAVPTFSPQPHAAAIGAICRRLDGIPLAIEFAAARAAVLGVETVLSRLDDRFELLSDSRRTSLPRQQTLRATLDWSYDLLPAEERRLLRHLAVFAGGFPLAAAAAMLSLQDASEPAVIETIANLVSKALVTLHEPGTDARWRLLETIRAYALEKLAENGETEQASRRHAQFYHDAFVLAAEAAPPAATIARMAHHGREIDNVRQALDWAFAANGDVMIGVALTAAYAPVWLYLSLLVECREQAERALTYPAVCEGLSLPLQIQLHTILGVALVYTGGSVKRTAAILTTAEGLSRHLDDGPPRLQVLWATWIFRFMNGEAGVARRLAEQFTQLADQPHDIIQSGRMMGSTMLYDGRHAQARQQFERLLGAEAAPASQQRLRWYHYDGAVLAQSRLARVSCLQGLVDQAAQLAADALARAQALDHKLSICFALSEAVCPIALLTGDLHSAGWSIDLLNEVATRHSFHSQMMLGRYLDAQLRFRRGDITASVGVLRTGLQTLGSTALTLHYAGMIADFAEALAASGELPAGLATIEAGVALAKRDGVRWHLAELHRVQGELRLRQDDAPSQQTADACFREAIGVAQRQGALFWELRAAISLARSLVRQDRAQEAYGVLAPVYDRFTEGFMRPDLRAARAVLDTLQAAARPAAGGS
jgi:predicted ATPase/DNA-binding winged helix-turn-helix (wHTH) protein